MREFKIIHECDAEDGSPELLSTPCAVYGFIYIEKWGDGLWHITDPDGFEIYGKGYKRLHIAKRYASAKAEGLDNWGC